MWLVFVSIPCLFNDGLSSAFAPLSGHYNLILLRSWHAFLLRVDNRHLARRYTTSVVRAIMFISCFIARLMIKQIETFLEDIE